MDRRAGITSGTYAINNADTLIFWIYPYTTAQTGVFLTGLSGATRSLVFGLDQGKLFITALASTAMNSSANYIA